MVHRESLFARVYVNGNAPRSPRKCSMISLYRKKLCECYWDLESISTTTKQVFPPILFFFLSVRFKLKIPIPTLIDNLSIELLSMTSHPPVIQYSVCMACSLPSLTLDHEVRCTFINSKSALIYPTFVSPR